MAGILFVIMLSIFFQNPSFYSNPLPFYETGSEITGAVIEKPSEVPEPSGNIFCTPNFIDPSMGSEVISSAGMCESVCYDRYKVTSFSFTIIEIPENYPRKYECLCDIKDCNP
jgi:hypothetical protein